MCTHVKNTTEHNIWYDTDEHWERKTILGREEKLFCVLLSCYDLAIGRSSPTLEKWRCLNSLSNMLFCYSRACHWRAWVWGQPQRGGYA